MKRYFFTYGTDGHPFRGGWTTVWADSVEQAIELFCVVHPRTDGHINCAGIYNEEDFNKTQMSEKGNFSKYCNEVIELKVTREWR